MQSVKMIFNPFACLMLMLFKISNYLFIYSSHSNNINFEDKLLKTISILWPYILRCPEKACLIYSFRYVHTLATSMLYYSFYLLNIWKICVASIQSELWFQNQILRYNYNTKRLLSLHLITGFTLVRKLHNYQLALIISVVVIFLSGVHIGYNVILYNV